MKKTISIFFSGTDFRIDNPSFLTASLYNRTIENETQLKKGFDGCGVLYPFRGGIFGSGLDEQCDEAIQLISKEIAEGHEITLNLYGHSRGAVGALMLAQQLSDVDPSLLSINLAMLDPVPGNMTITPNLDPFNISLANKTMDLTACQPLKKVLALYPHQSLFFHAPLFVSYPEHIELEEEVIAGCHAQAENLIHSASHIASLRIEEFLAKNGTQWEASAFYLKNNNSELNARYKQFYERDLNKIKKSETRDTHSAKGVYINTKTGAQYFNEHHKRLCGGTENDSVALSIEYSYSPISLLKRLTTNYPVTSQIIKWAVLSLLLGCLLYFTGGLAAIPMVSLFVAKIGAVSILAAAPFAGSALAAVWYGVINPMFSWAANRFFYPKYFTRDLAPVEAEQNTESSTNIAAQLMASNGLKNNIEQQIGEAPYQGKSLFTVPPQAGEQIIQPQEESLYSLD